MAWDIRVSILALGLIFSSLIACSGSERPLPSSDAMARFRQLSQHREGNWSVVYEADNGADADTHEFRWIRRNDGETRWDDVVLRGGSLTGTTYVSVSSGFTCAWSTGAAGRELGAYCNSGISPLFRYLQESSQDLVSVASTGTTIIANIPAECFFVDALIRKGEVCLAETGLTLRMNLQRLKPQPGRWRLSAIDIQPAPAGSDWARPMFGGVDDMPLSVKDAPVAEAIFPDLPVVREFFGADAARFATTPRR